MQINKLRNIYKDPLKLFEFVFYQKSGVTGCASRKTFLSTDSLINHHFSQYSSHNHPCKDSLSIALNELQGNPAQIVETGSSAWGVNSSLLFDSYVNSFGGNLYSVDIRSKPMLGLIWSATKNSIFYCNDSVNFLKKFSKQNISLLYLDSCDVDWTNPLPSSIHGLNEFLSILPNLSPGTLLLIDDTPSNIEVMKKVHPNRLKDFELFKKKYDFYPGKGSLVLNYLQQRSIGKLINHDYQVLWRL